MPDAEESPEKAAPSGEYRTITSDIVPLSADEDLKEENFSKFLEAGQHRNLLDGEDHGLTIGKTIGRARGLNEIK